MTDITNPTVKRSIKVVHGTLSKRNKAEKRFRMFGAGAIITALILLLILAFTIIKNGAPAFTRTAVQIDFMLSQAGFDKAESGMLKTAAYTKVFAETVAGELSIDGVSDKDLQDGIVRILGKVGGDIRAHYKDAPEDIGTPVMFELSAASRAQAYIEGDVTRDGFTDSRFLTTADLDILDAMQAAGMIQNTWDTTFFFGADAGVDNPGGAGVGVSVVGSLFMMIVVLVLSLPIAVAASIYLEEFAPQNWFTDFIEVNISNLAAVPSIVFGILGLAIFIQFAELPQSSPIVGGLVLALMTLPTIIIATRASLKAVPPSIRDAALGLGASKTQAVFHHVLPLAAPGILTGTIIGLAQALGETAPLLLIGMVGFVAREYPDTIVEGFTQANSAMPAQIYTWASRADPGFYEKAWGGIIVLLIFLLAMNIIAIILRRRFERRW